MLLEERAKSFHLLWMRQTVDQRPQEEIKLKNPTTGLACFTNLYTYNRSTHGFKILVHNSVLVSRR